MSARTARVRTTGVFLLTIVVARAEAAQLEISLSSRVSYGNPVVLSATLVNPERGTGRPELPRVDGLDTRGPLGPSQQLTSDGRRRQVSLVYSFQITPQRGRTGTFKLGPVRVVRTGKAPLVSNTVELGVFKRPPAGLLFRGKIIPPEGDVGDTFRAVYTLYFPLPAPRRRDPFSVFDDFLGERTGLKELEFPLLAQGGLQVRAVAPPRSVEQRAVKLGEFRIPYAESFAAMDDGTGYQTMAFTFEVEPLRPGNIELGGARAVMALGTGQTDRRGREIVRQYQATVEPLFYTVRPLPSRGVPEAFTDAVGRYSISVQTNDTEVAAFDPITLEIRVEGRGILEDLQPPAWARVAALTRDFAVSTDVDSGRVEGKAKVFRQMVRPRHENVTEIPKIPFPYYDPWKKAYETAYSDAIPIVVRAANTVTAESAYVKSGRSTEGETQDTQPTPILEEIGVEANFSEPGAPAALLTAGEQLLSPRYAHSRLFLVSLIASPWLFVLVWLGVRLRRRDPALRARRQAFSVARSALKAAASDHDAVSVAFQDYFRQRWDLPPGEITPPQLHADLERRGAPPETAESCRDLLEQLLAGRFGAAGASAAELAEAAVEVLWEVERCGVR